jgi:hypothetical protein
VERLLAEGLTAARTEGDAFAEANVLAHTAMRCGDTNRRRAMWDEVREIIDRAEDQVPFVELLSYQANNEHAAGNVRGAQEILDHAAALAARDARAPVDILYYQLASIAFTLGDLDKLDAVNLRYERAVETASPHVRMHAQRGRALLEFARADWPALRAVADHVAGTIDEHPETVFCVASAASLGWGSNAAAVSGNLAEARDLLARARRITTQPNVAEAVIAGALASLGMRGDVLRIDDYTPPGSWTTVLAAALAAIDAWDRVRQRLPALDRMAAGSNRFAEALASALREELAAREGGPPPTHAALREIGYIGISALLSFRPNVARG